MKTSTLLKSATILALSGTTAFAGGLDRSGQPTSIIFEEGHYLEFTAAFVNPSVSGTYSGALNGTSGNQAEDYSFFGLGYRGETKDGAIGYAVIYDEPYGSNIRYGAGTGTGGATLNGLSGEVSTEALTFLGQYNIGNGFSVHGGLRVQQGDATAFLPAAVVAANGGPNATYSVSGDADTAWGAVIGAAYERPEIGLRVAATYSTAIDHDVTFSESFGGGAPQVNQGSIEFPESINLEFQSGINQSTLVFGSIRWANYSDFTLSPTVFTAGTGDPLVEYEDDGWDYSLGVARRITDNFVATFSVGYQPSTDTSDPSAFSPSDGRISYALAGIYTVGNAEITAGVRYTDLNDEDLSLANGAAAGAFQDNDAVSFGLRVGFQL